jgi:hypothetical protein
MLEVPREIPDQIAIRLINKRVAAYAQMFIIERETF